MEAIRYKVLYADDEYWTREKMKRIISWEEYSLEFLEPACDGEEVLERIKTEKPDILITDINMPYVNGVELLQKIEKESPDIITFVISGYDDFSYVKDSFLAGSINYLMKPVGKIDLVNALSKALEIIGERRTRQKAVEKQEIELRKAASFLQDREFSLLLDKKYKPAGARPVGNDGNNFAAGALLLVKLHNPGEFAQMYGYDMNLLSFSIKKRLREIIEDEKALIFNHVYRSSEFLILTGTEESRTGEMAARILRDLSKAASCPMTVIESEHCFSMENLNEAYVQDISCMMLRPFGSGQIYLKASKVQNAQRGTISARISEQQFREMRGLIKEGNRSGLKTYIFDRTGLAHCKKNGWTFLEVRQTVRGFVNLLENVFYTRLDPKALAEAQSLSEIADNAVETMQEERLREILEEIVDFYMNISASEPSASIKSGIKQAVDYVNAHYMEQLSLESLSRQFHVERTYFSRMFRKETGDNLMLFICKRRMEKAEEYMRTTDKNLTEIAFMVGYDDYTYFNKVFRRMRGQSPREFRSEIMKSPKNY